MKVTKGYKQTELGEIPDDWHFKTFGEVMKGFSSGQTPSRSVKKYYTGKIPWITSGELNYKVITDTIEKITAEAATNTHLKTIPVGTFLMAITGLEAEGTRGSCGITGVEVTTNQSCMALYPNDKELTTEYLFQFYVKYGNWLAFKYCQGTKQQSYTGKIAKTLPIIFPPTVEEQNAITNALNEIDSLIADLQKLITKKQNIKQGTMQVLLTGKKRLRGFKGQWEEKCLDDVIEIIADGGTPATSNQSYFGGNINWIVIEDIKDKIHSTRQTLTELGLSRSSSKLWSPGTIILSTGATIGEVGITYVHAATKQGICGIVVRKNTSNLFLKYWLQFNKSILLSKAQGSTIKEIRPPIILKLNISIPDIHEQHEIANVLKVIDQEIEILQRQLSKYKLMKEGMMQNLLTGKVRLV
ncbi:MAG: restriction endonuclease subunit S [Bacteroidetes bacterium]|nr:restriction endonuclease subunit S [Bacteroidota bacterium]